MTTKGTKRRFKGTGYIFPRNGTYYLKTTVNGKQKLQSLKTKSKKEAEEKAKEILPILNAKTKEELAFHIGEARNLLRKKHTKLQDTWNTYLKNSTRPDSGKGTLSVYHCYWERFIKSLPPSIKCLEQITAKDAQEYMEKLAESKISNRTYNSVLQSLKLVMRILTKGSENPFNEISSKTIQVVSKKDFTKEEVKKIFEVFDDAKVNIPNKDEMKVMFHIGCWTGLRLKDCALLKWPSINLNNNTISIIPYKVARKSNNNVIIPIHPLLKTELYNALDWRINEFVLPKVAEKYLFSPNGLKKDCIKIIKNAGLNTTQKIDGITRKLNANIYGFHSFRHSFVSFCAQAGVPMAIVQAIVGHGSPAMTKHYTHIGSETLKTAINTLPAPNYNQEETIRGKINKLLDVASAKELEECYYYLKSKSNEMKRTATNNLTENLTSKG